ncbi:MAG: DNA polymerase III subunit alpha [Alphaproteobacteria bacterium]|nr:DNA polymerase III subunit alpha [Alphaproteobacteria bacterium]
MQAEFVHLRVHSAYSLAEGAVRIPELIALCREHNLPAVAVTDTANLFGALEFALAGAKGGIQPIIGCQLAILADSDKTEAAVPASELIVLVQSEAGYRNLLHLVSQSYATEDPLRRAQLSLGDLSGNTDGLIALTGGVAGAVARLLANGQREAAAQALQSLTELFPGRLYVELQRHGLDSEARVETALIDLAYANDLPLVATNEVFFTDGAMYEAHDALLCISQSAYVSQSDRRRVTPDHRFKSAAEMRALFADLPEAIDNTLVIAQRCVFMPAARSPMLPPYATGKDVDENVELRQQAEAGLETRLTRHVYNDTMDQAARTDAAVPYKERLKFELQVIEDMGYSGYFLIVADFIKWSKSHDIAVGPGRGSGAGSVVAWSLTITDLDPLRWGLFFERFLNPERVSMPDFDIDFCQERRDEVIAYVQDRYGYDRVAQIITFGKLQARAVVRDVGRVLEMPYGLIDRIAKLVPANPANPVSLQQALDSEPQLQELQRNDENIAHLLDLALKLEGLYRNSSTHAAGVVIADRPLEEIIPLYRDPRSETLATQFSMKYVELAGLVKFDFLGLKTLDVLQKSVSMLANRGIAIDLESLPLDDAATFEMLSRGDTTGVFQCESSGVRDVLRKLKPDRFEDIIAVVALYRPGPMDNIPSYINRKHGREPVDYLHKNLEECLSETYGIPIYQEQVMQMAQALAGFTLGGADLLRRAMGKKIKAEMDAQRDVFVSGAKQRNVDEDTAVRIFETIAKFAGYGFNKAHATAYALIAYQTAYLKANYPVEFFAASMTLDMSNTDKLALYQQELELQNIALLPPDINRSEVEFSVDTAALAAPDGDAPPSNTKGGAIRYALAAIKGVGPAAMAMVVQERRENGSFNGVFDVAGRVDPQALNKRLLEHLVAAGAFDALNGNRAQVFLGIDRILSHAHAQNAERQSGQFNLLGDSQTGGLADAPRLEPVDDWPQVERLERELDAVGFYLSAHPLDEYVSALERLGVLRYDNLHDTVAANGGTMIVMLAGTVLNLQHRTSQRGSRYAFIQLSDSSGAFEVTAFSEVLAANREILENGKPVLLQVAARLEEGQLRLTVQSVRDIDSAAATAPMVIKIWLDDPAPLQSLKSIIDREASGENGNGGRGRGRISLMIPSANREVEVRLDGAYMCTPQVRAAIRAIPGVLEVQEA